MGELRSRFGVEPVLRVLGIASSTYHGWVRRQAEPPRRRRDDETITAEIVDIRTASGGTYGSPRVHQVLRRRAVRVSRKRVERLMRQAGLQGAFLRKKWRTSSTRQDPRATPAPDRVNRDFTAPAPNRLWVADATRIPTGEGTFRLAAVRDAFSNRIVGWKTGDRCDTDLVLGALEYAIWSRDVRDGQLVHHSDRGSTYTSIRFGERLADNGILPSMGSVGDSYDNALMENFFSTLKIELVYRKSWRTRDEAANAIFGYIDGFYNTERIQKDLGWLSPDEYEAARNAAQTKPSIIPTSPTGAR
ncbi:IS3 family transposase [Actinosynnema sp. NPDC047251]|uniref:Transposase n=1 Tax=Saccharothrix espanaensis (strain ATCC 51144 / DSM 44229 / JCM 9112 / NBRC 15066 / NRRL 15764) TaxID=1179773 RepID=K0K3T2_SACES|nr:IS3 family transposase [Saccharothrix espanaensis]CCH32976.1 Transposase [Saccharothrix espanaensis DSM 44229]